MKAEKIFIKADSTVSDCTLFTHDDIPIHLNEPLEPQYCFSADELKELLSQSYAAGVGEGYSTGVNTYEPLDLGEHSFEQYLSSLNIQP